MAEQTQLQSKQQRWSWLQRFNTRKMRWRIEVGLAFSISILIAIIFAMYGQGGPGSSDITLYMNVGMNGIKMPFILNRYFHVFLQAIFLKLASHPLQGYHAFWGFIVGLNAFLVYLSARKALKRSNILHGLLAVLIFFSFAAIAETSGVIVVDFTAMTMMTAFFTVYLYSLNHNHERHWMLVLLGALFFLAFKTKETTLPVGVLLIGVGWVLKRFQLKQLLRNLLWILAGVLVGMVIFAILSWIFLGDPLFGLRISEWRGFFGTYAVYSSRVLETMNNLADGNLDDWYQGYWFKFTLLPFVFYLISGVMTHRKNDIPRRLLWLVPLAYTVFLIISINNRLGYEIRFGLPVMPILAALSPQFINLKWPDRKPDQRKLLIVAAVGVVFAVGIRVWLRLVIPAQNLDLGSVVTLMYYPLLITLLFVLLFLFKEDLYANALNCLIVLSLMVSPVASNFRSMFVVKENYKDFQQVVLPFSEFEDEIVSDADMRFYATYAVFDRAELKIGKNEDELLSLFNVYFDASTTRENFTYSENPQDISADILAEGFDYVLLTMDNWIGMQVPEEELVAVKAQYTFTVGSGGDFVLLTPQQ